MAVSAVSGSVQVQANLTCSNTITGAVYGPNQNNTAFSKKLAFILGGNTAGGINQVYSAITTIAPSGNASIDLTSIANILGQSGITLSRVKAILVQLLSSTDDATNGTAASSITLDGTVANGLSGQSHAGWFDNTASNFALKNGDFVCWGTTQAAGLLVDSTHKLLRLVNNDGGVSAAVQITIWAADS